MIIKNLKKYFTFEVQVISNGLSYDMSNVRSSRSFRSYWNSTLQSNSFVDTKVLDDKNVKRRFRASNYQSTTRVKPFICTMPMRLDDGWNQIQVNFLKYFVGTFCCYLHVTWQRVEQSGIWFMYCQEPKCLILILWWLSMNDFFKFKM